MDKIEYPEVHKNDGEFEALINFTISDTGFRAELIEKDYFCSLLLYYFYKNSSKDYLVFKGGTCLNKVHMDFYRLSEDLDFSIPVGLSSSKAERKEKISLFKKAYNKIKDDLDVFKIEEIKGYNECTQYKGIIKYNSVITGQVSNIKVEVGLREPLLNKAFYGEANTLLKDPYYGFSLITNLNVYSLSLKEALAEKVRAALTRKDIAIRDYYDIYYAVKNNYIKIADKELIELIKVKLNNIKDSIRCIDDDTRVQLEKQVIGQLKPVLRDEDYKNFNLTFALQYVKEIHDKF